MNRWLAGNVVWPLSERLVGRDTMRRFQTLLVSDRYSARDLADIQQRKLARLLRLAGEHCPFYRDRFRQAGIDPRDPQLGLDVLSALPLLERDDVQEHLDEMTWCDCPGGPARPYTTGGSTGQPLQFYIDRCRQSADWAARWRARSWWGLPPGSREIMLWAGAGRVAVSTPDRLRTLRDRWLNQFILDAFNMTDRTMDEYARQIATSRPRLLYGYSSSLALLARQMLNADRVLTPEKSPRAVFVTGETVTPRDVHDIQAAFGAPVVVEYGSRDCGFMAGGCEAGRLHVADENVIVEVLDEHGRPTAPGEVGEVVVTCLESFATPLIRYRVGDLALVPRRDEASHDGRCPCGRASRQLTEIRGRITDQIVRYDAGEVRRMHALSLIYVLREAPGVRQFRIVQNSLQAIDVELVADGRFTPAIEESVTRALRERMGADVEIRIHRRERIAPTASGKHACVVSNVECAVV
ncbi:MAG TPA: phenylacetate--CoA ligase family protein [Phycisphaerae bacterium]|nr:phenylacetate--CoA ligase family protein [Phycisphaerae bacterium]HOJ72672.1 phenylacetate--CoA ligase family protein [Phycisphaerae bacterium]HOM49667.1 phenylacetate--CoA ligase family protein [Phycisphaerae bacterium]HPP25036.1 phenylacetate--CoA ligase family protein [Phycisphaerae bacterium]HPU24797.1 phenylacetate--CoA ligase family protein [Phycisphaerae bacterium]